MPAQLPIRVMELRCTYRWGGGPDKTILNSARMHDKAILDVLVVYIRSMHDHEFTLVKKARDMGVRVEELVERSSFDTALVGEVLRIIDTNRIQVIHSRDYKTNFLALLIKTFYRRDLKIVTMAHGWVGTGFKLGLYYTLDKILASFFDRNFLLFNGQRKQFIRKPSASKTVVIHNAIDHADWDPKGLDKSALRKEFSIADSAAIIGYVGRIMPEKDILSMIAVAQELVVKRKRDVAFVLVGECVNAAYFNQIKQQINRWGLGTKVFFTGPRTDLKQIYCGLDLFLMTSLQEGFPNSLLEAMAMKVPAVVSAVDGIPEILADGKSGLLCKPRDIAGFCSAIERVLNDKPLAASLISNARARVESDLSFERRLKRVEEEYVKLFNE